MIRPILQRHATSGVFFITTDFIDDRALFFETKVSLCLSAVERLGDQEARERVASLELKPDPPTPAGVHWRSLGYRWRGSPPRPAPPTGPCLWLLGFQQDDEAGDRGRLRGPRGRPGAYSRRRPLYLSPSVSDSSRPTASPWAAMASPICRCSGWTTISSSGRWSPPAGSCAT